MHLTIPATPGVGSFGDSLAYQWDTRVDGGRRCRLGGLPDPSASFEVGPRPRTICHHRGEVERCWTAPTYRNPASWSVSALLDDLLGPDGATSEADPYFDHQR